MSLSLDKRPSQFLEHIFLLNEIDITPRRKKAEILGLWSILYHKCNFEVDT